MQPHEVHHIKTYIVFFIVSVVFIGTLLYLYFPEQDSQSKIKSSVINAAQWNIDITGKQTLEQTSKNSVASEKRIRLTKLLIRAQKELQLLESQRKDSENGLDTALEEKIAQVRNRISNIEKLISETE